MGTFLEVQSAVRDRTGVATGYNTKLKRCINNAQFDILLTRWDFLYTTSRVGSGLVAGEIEYQLPSDFGEMNDGDAYYDMDDVNGDSVRVQLQKGNLHDIFLFPSSTTGNPQYYTIAGNNGTQQNMYIGAPTCSSGYGPGYAPGSIVYIGYYPKPTTLTDDTDTSVISSMYGDKPLVSYATYLFWKDMEEFDKAQDSLKEAIIDVKNMENRMGFVGDSLSQRLQEDKGVVEEDD